MRIATYNVEWFSALFDRNNQLYDDGEWSSRYQVTRREQTAAIGRVFQALDADAVMIIEAPDQNKRQSTVQSLETFAAHFELRTTDAVMGYSNETQQEIALLYDPNVLQARHDPRGAFSGPEGASGAPRFDGALLIDLDIELFFTALKMFKFTLEFGLFIVDLIRIQVFFTYIRSTGEESFEPVPERW